MKYISTIPLLFITCLLFSQTQAVEIRIDPDQNKNKQYIIISSNGKKILSNQKQPYKRHEIKGHFKSVEVEELYDAFAENIANDIDLDVLNADSTFATVEYTDSIFATINYVDSTFAPNLYDEYVVELTLSGTSNPTAFVLDTLTGRTITWTRSDIGTYFGDISTDLTTPTLFNIQPLMDISDTGATFRIGLGFPADIIFAAYSGGTETDMEGTVQIFMRVYNSAIPQ